VGRRRSGHLSREDRALWEQVARRTRPLPGRAPRPVPEPSEDAQRPVSPETPRGPLAPFRVGSRAIPPPETAGSPMDGAADRATLRMDRKVFARLKGGKLVPQARIDLHGMTLAQAHPALTGFVLRSQSAGHRLVLVITGKGRGSDGDGPIPERRGVLKRQVPHWLRQPPLAAAVLDVTEAHRRHGGEGAFYVYLRRAR